MSTEAPDTPDDRQRFEEAYSELVRALVEDPSSVDMPEDEFWALLTQIGKSPEDFSNDVKQLSDLMLRAFFSQAKAERMFEQARLASAAAERVLGGSCA